MAGGRPLGVETLDAPDCSPHLARATLADISVANRLLGGWSAVWRGVSSLLVGQSGRTLTLLDVGAGAGDVARHVTRKAARLGTSIRAVALDRLSGAVAMSRELGMSSVRADACQLPLAPRSVDLIIANQLLHHFAWDDAAQLIAAFQRTARLGVVVADLRRAYPARVGIWLASWALRFHPVTRHDGVLSVRRGYTAAEFAALLRAAGVEARVECRPGYRLVAAWKVRQ